ncbi:hypothetical protein [Haloarcula amylovorans]|uniref:hypothetical protein n=1 Tax=Haloarcula amylovorans TaxID=2562280 RepID=UPI0010760BF4|nr:hypothetical protein [Halomicroarcula amylolytica]
MVNRAGLVGNNFPKEEPSYKIDGNNFLVSASGDLAAMGTIAWRVNAVVAFAIALAVDHQMRVHSGRV